MTIRPWACVTGGHTMTFVRLITSIFLVVLLAAAASWGAPAATKAAPAKPATAQIVDLELTNVTVPDAIARLFSGTGLKYAIEPGVSGKVVELRLKGVTFAQALDALAEAARFSYVVRDGVYVLSPTPSSSAGSYGSGAAAKTAQSPPAAGKAAPPTTLGPSGGAESPQTSQDQSAPGQQAASSGNVIINEQHAPVYYGEPGPSLRYSPYGLGGWPPVYGYGNVRILGGYPPIVVAGGNPYVIRRVPPLPPPRGFVGPEVERFLRGQWAIHSRTIITPY